MVMPPRHDTPASPRAVPGVVFPMRSPGLHSPPSGDAARLAAPVGRELPLARLLDSLKAVLNGTSRSCVITGEAGIGKTRLLAELLDRARVHDCLVLSGKAQDYDHGIAAAGRAEDLHSWIVTAGRTLREPTPPSPAGTSASPTTR
jgi:AAA ATPase domain